MTDKFNTIPKDVLDKAAEISGMDPADIIRMDALSHAVVDFAMNTVSEGDTISVSDLALCALACKMAGSWLAHVALEEAA